MNFIVARRWAARLGMVAMFVAVLGLAGCGKKVSGVYEDANGTFKIEFKSGGKAYLTAADATQEADYTLDGDKVTLKTPGDNIVLTLKDDGTLDGPLGMHLKKKT